MSTNDAAMVEEQSREPDAAAAPPAEALPRFDSPIVPQATIAGRALVAVVAIMTFLASLTTGAVMLVRAAASEWQADVGREVTIQIRPNPGADIELDVAKAAAIARRSAGVVEVRAHDDEFILEDGITAFEHGDDVFAVALLGLDREFRVEPLVDTESDHNEVARFKSPRSTANCRRPIG